MKSLTKSHSMAGIFLQKNYKTWQDAKERDGKKPEMKI
jgi:hypothetical protein